MCCGKTYRFINKSFIISDFLNCTYSMSDELPEHLQLIEQYQKLIQQQVKRRSRFIYLQPWGKSTIPLSFSFPCMNFHFFIVPLPILKREHLRQHTNKFCYCYFLAYPLSQIRAYTSRHH